MRDRPSHPSLLNDVRAWQPQALGIAETNRAFASPCAEAPIVRNVVIIPSTLIRRRRPRTLAGNICRMFEQYDDADAWLTVMKSAGRR